MRVLLSGNQAKEPLLPENIELVRCAYYLGYKYTSVYNMVRLPKHARERSSVMETAKLLGISDQDVISIDESLGY